MSAMQACPHPRLPPVRGMAADWVRQLDRAEAAMYGADPNDPYAQRNASRLLTSLFALEHQMTPTARRQAREHVWLRDKAQPLPDEDTRSEWEHCCCNRCRLERCSLSHRAAMLDHRTAAPVAPLPVSSVTPIPLFADAEAHTVCVSHS